MFLSEPAKADSQEVKEFQLPGLDDPTGAQTPALLEFQLWDYGVPDGGPPGDQALVAGAEDFLAGARLKAQEIERQAYEEGFEQGQKDGQEVGRRGLEEVIQRLQHLAAALEQEREVIFRQREGLLVELVLLVSEKLVARELSLHPEAIRQIIEEGFQQASHQEGLRLLVSPPDYEILQRETLGSWPPGVELGADGTINPGGFRLETALGEVDGTRETRFALIVQAVQQALESLDAHPPED